ncbi:SRPBCC family protein [Nocardia sp. alder85J]|uniref:SRPBCC family protein n=1 Tax=Nocardia sp. alder85J TaxID=2862949 RepID=UPI001CD1C1B6|nr:SRPBCC family protein [Nocardia sp. alder85J]MCX4092960.1 SRPBCC family protein [Nocardia sp. alder85J]
MSEYGTLVTPDTVRIEREVRGPIERVWAFLTEPGKRRTWLAGGEVEPCVGGTVAHVFRNAELTGEPRGPVDEHLMPTTILAWDPPRLLTHTWEDGSEVTFELTPVGDRVRLVVTHRRIAGPAGVLNYSAGWHAHLDLLADRLAGRTPPYFDDAMAELRDRYAARLGHTQLR